uniref:Uncharacterized protein n=1 Tax=Steinernema glaseri TaxID=37863 RepID=A0A1I7YR20_9BILA
MSVIRSRMSSTSDHTAASNSLDGEDFAAKSKKRMPTDCGMFPLPVERELTDLQRGLTTIRFANARCA